MPHPSDFNPIAPETVECPYPFYQAMRDQQPVHEVPGAGFFIVSPTRTFFTFSIMRRFFRRWSHP